MRSVKKNNELFTIDDLGNRTQVNLRNGSNENYVVNNTTNYYTSIDGNTIGYDDAGNMTADKDGYKYYYDYENRLVKVTKSSGPEVTVAEYAYDALGRRIRKIDSIGSETTLYYYNNNWQVVTEANSVGDTARYFVYGNFIDELLMMHDCSADEDYYACQDHLYSNVALVGQNGTVVERYEYDAYGKPTIYNADFTQTYSDSQYGNCYMFTGRRLDTLDNSGLKLQYNRNRYYSSEMGRWLTKDPLGITPEAEWPNQFNSLNQYIDSLNCYDYVCGQILSYGDPYGLALFRWGPWKELYKIENDTYILKDFTIGGPYYYKKAAYLDGPIERNGICCCPPDKWNRIKIFELRADVDFYLHTEVVVKGRFKSNLIGDFWQILVHGFVDVYLPLEKHDIHFASNIYPVCLSQEQIRAIKAQEKVTKAFFDLEVNLKYGALKIWGEMFKSGNKAEDYLKESYDKAYDWAKRNYGN